MKKRIILVVSLILALLVLSSCQLIGLGNPDDEVDAATKFESITLIEEKQFDFKDGIGSIVLKNGEGGSVAEDDGESAYQKGVLFTSTDEVNDGVPNASLYGKFSLDISDEYLCLSVGTLSNQATGIRVKLEYLKDGELLVAYPELFSGYASKGEDGFYMFAGIRQDLVFDLSPYRGKVAVITVEHDAVFAGTCEKMYLYSMSIGSEYDEVSTLSEWNAQQILSDFDLTGDIYSKDGFAAIKSQEKYSSLSNKLRITDDNPYLTVTFKADDDNVRLKLLVDGDILEPAKSIVDYLFATSEKMTVGYFDLRDYEGQTVSLQIVNASESIALVESISFEAECNIVSQSTSWDVNKLQREWGAKGNTTLHTEGYCLEASQEGTSIENIVRITDNHKYLNISFRMFVRPEGQEKDTPPQIEVYVNNKLITAIGASESYVSVYTDAYEIFAYDLSEFVGQDVTIKIATIAGQHACFDMVYLDGTAEIEEPTYNSEQYVNDNLYDLAVEEDRTFVFYQYDSFSGWSYGDAGKEYDKATWELSGRMGESCIRLDGSDFGDDRDYMPNAWIYNKFTLSDNDAKMSIRLTASEDANANVRVRVLYIEDDKLVSVVLDSEQYSGDLDSYGYYLLDNENVENNTYYYDLSAFAGKTVLISIEQDDNGEGSGEMVEIYEINIGR